MPHELGEMPLKDIIISPGNLSDLFFNHDHAHRRRVFAKYSGKGGSNVVGLGGPPEDEVNEALAYDVNDFVDCLAGAVTDDEKPALRAWLIADFKKRV